MNCSRSGCKGDSIHNRIREVDGKNITLVYVCFTCGNEWWASKELRDRFGNPKHPYYDPKTKSVISDRVGTEVEK